MIPNKELLQLLLPAYSPCSNFGHCKQAKWSPSEGQVPRGYLGATGELDEVEIIMVFAEPGHPHDSEKYNINNSPSDMLEDTIKHVYDCYKNGTDLFHRNVRWFINELYPDKNFDEQLKHIWLTEGRLCSIDDEIGNTKDYTCAKNYLKSQINLLSSAAVVGFGGKAKSYLHSLKVDFIPAYALAPPGANHKPARPTWVAAIDEIKNRR